MAISVHTLYDTHLAISIQIVVKQADRTVHRYPTTPDGRYVVVRGRLWRCSNPHLTEAERKRLTHDLMQARSAKGRAVKAGDTEAREQARKQVDAAKHALGERGEPWWTDGAPDYNRHLVKNTPYAEWFSGL